MTSMPHFNPEAFPGKQKPKTAKELFETLQKMGAFGLWKDIPNIEDSLDLARKLRESQTRY